MLAKLSVSILLALTAMCATTFGQQPNIQYHQFTANQNALASYHVQEKDDASEKLEQQLKRMELRLRELEHDIEEKLKSQPDAAKEAAEKNEEVDERLSELEESFEEQSDAVGKLEDSVPNFVVSGHKSPKLKFFGRIHTDYWAFPKVDETLEPLENGDDPEDRFNFRRLRIGVSGDLNDNVFYKYEGEFAAGAGGTSFRDALIGFKNLPYLNKVIIGNHKRPYGLDHLNSSRHNVFIERPFIIEAFNEDSRRFGISSNGVSEDQGWNWRYGVWNQQLTQTIGGFIGDHYQLELAGRLARTAWWDESSDGRGYAHWAISGSVGTPDGRGNNQARFRTRPESRTDNRWLDTQAIDGANTTYLIGFESVINVGAFNVTSEYQRTFVDRLAAVGDNVAFDGYYTQISYFLTGEHRAWNRETGTLARVKPYENFFAVRDCDGDIQRGWGAWEIAGRYSNADLNDLDVLGGEAESFTFGLNWYWNAYARMQFNYIIGEVASGTGNLGQGDYEIFGVRFMVDF